MYCQKLWVLLRRFHCQKPPLTQCLQTRRLRSLALYIILFVCLSDFPSKAKCLLLQQQHPPPLQTQNNKQCSGLPFKVCSIIQLQSPRPLIEIDNLTGARAPVNPSGGAGPPAYTPPSEEQASGRDGVDRERGEEGGG